MWNNKQIEVFLMLMRWFNTKTSELLHFHLLLITVTTKRDCRSHDIEPRWIEIVFAKFSFIREEYQKLL